METGPLATDDMTPLGWGREGADTEKVVRDMRFAGKGERTLGDPLAATAIVDRLLHRSQVITSQGEGYRLRETRNAELRPFGEVAAA